MSWNLLPFAFFVGLLISLETEIHMQYIISIDLYANKVQKPTISPLFSFMEFRISQEYARNAVGINIIGCYWRYNRDKENKCCTLSYVLCHTHLYIYKVTQVRQCKSWNKKYLFKIKQFVFQLYREFPQSEKYLTCKILKLACISLSQST